ncbi:hypothetical protein BJV82DRAFT_672786 [Fennellomyces sp. T-0311]|nr:hypothetical protein BJV82DRAFT_672786 [Fennellomyces sp. T-0311]
MDPRLLYDLNDGSIDNGKRRRMNHNANERYRRSVLNAQYDQLARALPLLCKYNRRPSKRVIIEAALAWVYQTQLNEFRYREELLRLQRENARLTKKAAQQHF